MGVLGFKEFLEVVSIGVFFKESKEKYFFVYLKNWKMERVKVEFGC